MDALRFIGAFGLAVAFIASDGNACSVPQSYDPNRAFEFRSREAIVASPEVIVAGVVERPDPIAGDSLRVATMQVDRVWKGDLGPTAVLLYVPGTGDCSKPPPFGRMIRFGARLVDAKLLQNSGEIAPEHASIFAGHAMVLAYPRYIEFMDLPVQDGELDRLLVAYRAETEALRQRAESGERQDRLAYAAHLFDKNEYHRARDAYEGILRDNPDDLDLLLTLAVVRAQVRPYEEPEATLAELERKAPHTTEWQGKIVRTRFAASGRLTPGWKDWSDLRPAQHCEVSEGNFDDANFDRAVLTDCEFVRSSFRNASLLHTDLSAAYFENSSLTGAKYDCATKLPEDLDPAAAGMINVEGRCATP